VGIENAYRRSSTCLLWQAAESDADRLSDLFLLYKQFTTRKKSAADLSNLEKYWTVGLPPA
jgi:hypothetical protein